MHDVMVKIHKKHISKFSKNEILLVLYIFKNYIYFVLYTKKYIYTYLNI